MKAKEQNKLIVVIHGPNMNIINHKPCLKSNNLTLDKINNHLKQETKNINKTIKFMQTNSESRAVHFIHKKRKKISGIIIFPGPWQKSAYSIKDTLEILNIPFVTISTGEQVELLIGSSNINEKDILLGCRLAIKAIDKLI